MIRDGTTRHTAFRRWHIKCIGDANWRARSVCIRNRGVTDGKQTTHGLDDGNDRPLRPRRRRLHPLPDHDAGRDTGLIIKHGSTRARHEDTTAYPVILSRSEGSLRFGVAWLTRRDPSLRLRMTG